MGDITAERRLELVRYVREENNRNRMRMRTRENILYGKRKDTLTDSYAGHYEENSYDARHPLTEEDTAPASGKVFSGLWVRTLLATVLFAIYIILDFSGGSVLSVNSDAIHAHISENYTPNVIDFMQEITYTLNDAESNSDR
ncbi:MAG: hypothetical protein IJ405_04380 [Lachnospiraceae bacterium]|nr:hypothetical protein [Lachnospiraceae bacterium]MBQ7781242.1 hypothetical protein [Lachnospiraceae bacterium]